MKRKNPKGRNVYSHDPFDHYFNWILELPISNWNDITGFGMLCIAYSLPVSLLALCFILVVGETNNTGNTIIPPTPLNTVIVSVGTIPTLAAICFLTMGVSSLSAGMLGHLLYLINQQNK
jgi:hypothetical protein